MGSMGSKNQLPSPQVQLGSFQKPGVFLLKISFINSQNKKVQDGMRHIRPTTDDQKLQKEAHPNDKWPSNGWHHIFFGHVSLRILIESGLFTLCRLVWKLDIPWYTPKNPVQTSLEYGQWWLTSKSYWILKFQKKPHFFPGTCFFPTIAAGRSILARGFALRGARWAGSPGCVSLWIGSADLSERQDWKPWQNRWGFSENRLSPIQMDYIYIYTPGYLTVCELEKITI